MKKLSHSEQRKILEQKIKDLEQHALHLEERLDDANLSFELIIIQGDNLEEVC